MLRSWGVLNILTWKCASRHNGVQFFISHVAAGSAPAALASLLFDPPEPHIIGKTQRFATFLPFRASASSFFWLFLFSDLLSSNLSLLSASALLYFSSVYIAKLPSTICFDVFVPLRKFVPGLAPEWKSGWSLTQRSFYIEKPLHREAFTQNSLYTHKAFFETEAFARRSF